MKRIWASIAMLVLGALVLALPAYADGNLDTVVSSLNKSSVYVEPGVTGTDVNTAAELESSLTDDDQLRLVMVKSASDYNAVDASDLAAQLNKALDDKRIVAVSSGDKLTVATSIMPRAVASDLMSRAVSVSTSNTESLVTFVRNVHAWQVANPRPVAAKQQDGSSLWHWVWIPVLVIVVLVIFIGLVATPHGSAPSETVRLKKSPDVIRPKLEQLLRLCTDVEDASLRQTILQCVVDVENYFARFTSNQQEDSETFEEHLNSLSDVLTKYLELQSSPDRYYDDRAASMQQGKKAIEDFAEFVVNSIKRGSHVGLRQYSVNTQILQAQRYR